MKGFAMENGNKKDMVVAYVTMRTRSGLSIHKDIRKLSLTTIEQFRPNPKHLDQVVDLLTEAGFKIVARTAIGISICGPKKLFESEFKVKIHRKETWVKEADKPRQKVVFYKSSRTLMMSRRIERYAESVHLSNPAILSHLADPPAPSYYFLNVLTDVPELLNVKSLHANGITGAGVRVSMVDTGFVTRVTETHEYADATHVTVDHEIRDVVSVTYGTDSFNYFTGGSFAGNTITLGTQLPELSNPAAPNQVNVVYSCFHPHYLSQNYNIDKIDGLQNIPNIDVNADENGHGSAMAANVLAVAPGCTFSFVKKWEYNFKSHPLAGFQTAVNQSPNIISCSWTASSEEDRDGLFVEAVDAVKAGIVVLFSTGNKNIKNDGGFSIALPEVISIGGAYPLESGGFEASNYASSYDSVIHPQRHCPDVVGLVGNIPGPDLIMLPTQPDNFWDHIESTQFGGDGTTRDDGWLVMSGTSAATQQAAGVAALLLQKYPGLAPMAVKNILENSARDITTGCSGSSEPQCPQCADIGWDPATGFGLIDGQAAIDYLDANQFSPYIRDSVEDNGTKPVVAERLWTSPDIIVRREQVNEPQDELGQTVKYTFDLCDKVEDGQDNYVYLRVQNRGALTGDCTATVYFTAPGMFSNPAAWTEIGQLDIQNLEPGEFRVAGPLVWPDGLVPTSGHYCLIAILDSQGFPAPDLTTIHSTDDFVNMVRNSSNVAWRNIDVEDVIPGGASFWSFTMEGPLEDGCRTDLQININNFPGAGPVLVKVFKRIMNNAILDHMAIVEQSQIYTTFKHLGGIGGVQRMNLKHGETAKVTIYYSIPAKTPAGACPITATQLINGVAVNGYTKIVNVSSSAYVINRRTFEIHKRGCPCVIKMSSYDKMPFANLKKARKRGFHDCAICI